MPDASQNGKWEMASGKFRNCVGNCKASQEVNNLLIEQILKGGVPLFEERGTAFRFVVFRINIFRANDFLLELSFSGGGEFST